MLSCEPTYIFEVKGHEIQFFENTYFPLLSIVFVFITKAVEQKIVYKLQTLSELFLYVEPVLR